MSLRRRFCEIAGRAAEAGVDPSGLFDLTPAEIEWRLAAFAARERRALERLDEAAWLTGRYVAIGLNAPKRYPRRPDAVPRARTGMSDDEMKRVFARLARHTRKEENL